MRAAKAANSRKGGRAKVIRIKVISMGEQAVGKSCLIKR
jgi:GTPase SAR1 family protein